jgi:hypothetical protein
VSYRKVLRKLHPIYLSFIDRFLNESDIKKHDQIKIKEFIIMGSQLFSTQMLLQGIKAKLEENKVNLGDYNISMEKIISKNVE